MHPAAAVVSSTAPRCMCAPGPPSSVSDQTPGFNNCRGRRFDCVVRPTWQHTCMQICTPHQICTPPHLHLLTASRPAPGQKHRGGHARAAQHDSLMLTGCRRRVIAGPWLGHSFPRIAPAAATSARRRLHHRRSTARADTPPAPASVSMASVAASGGLVSRIGTNQAPSARTMLVP